MSLTLFFQAKLTNPDPSMSPNPTQEEIGPQLPPMMDTARAITSPGKLMRLERITTEVSMKKKLVLSLREEEVGTMNIEAQALKLKEEAEPGDYRGKHGKGEK